MIEGQSVKGEVIVEMFRKEIDGNTGKFHLALAGTVARPPGKGGDNTILKDRIRITRISDWKDANDQPQTAERKPRAMDRILLIDDNREIRELITRLFDEWGYATVTVATLAEARNAVLSEASFKAVVCDFALPDGNGLEFLAWLKSERQIHAPFLLISGSVDFDGCHPPDCSFLAKPFRMEELRSRIEELIENKPQSR